MHQSLAHKWEVQPSYEHEEGEAVSDSDEAEVRYFHPEWGCYFKLFEMEHDLCQHIVDLHNASLSATSTEAQANG